MNREILFKAKRKNWRELPKENWWVEGYVYRIAEELNPFIMRVNSHGESYEIDPETLCQYTGLNDKNGKRIWENDVVDGHFWRSVALWNEIKARFNGSDYIVIGNIFDNPELLGGAEEAKELLRYFISD